MKMLSTRHFLGSFLITILGCSGVIQAQTTMEEYRYLSKGVMASVEQGLDIKQGYEFDAIREWRTPVSPGSEATRISRVTVMYRTATKEPAGILMVVKRTDTQFMKAVAIPLPSSEEAVRSLARKDFDAALTEWTEQGRTYCWHLAMVLAQELEGRKKPEVNEDEEKPDPITQRYEACLKEHADWEYLVDNGNPPCFNEAMVAWEKEIKTLEGQLLKNADPTYHVGLKASFKAWETFYLASLDQHGQMLADNGASEWEHVMKAGVIELLKGRAAQLRAMVDMPQ